MKNKPSGSRPLIQGINALARAVAKPRLRKRAARGGAAGGSTTLVLHERAEALASDEVLIAIADADSVALRRVKIPARRPAAPSTRSSTAAQVARRLAEIELVASEMAQARPGAVGTALTDSEQRFVREGGLDSRPLRPSEAHLLHRASAEYARLLKDSYTVEEVARLLAVNTSRIRQRLTGTPRTLYGIKADRGWRVPLFQFHGGRLVPGIERVTGQIPPDVHPLAAHRWFTSPHPDLTFDDRSISPLDWLRLGNPAEVVAKLAADL